MKAGRPQRREVRAAYEAETRDEAPGAKVPSPCPQEKPRLASAAGARTKTDTGGRVEHTEAIGGTVVKELGKMAP